MSGNSNEDAIQILKQLQTEVVSIGQQVRDQVGKVFDGCRELPKKLKEAEIDRKLDEVQRALIDLSPVHSRRVTNNWLVNSYIWTGIGSAVNYAGQDIGRFFAPLFFGWWVSNFWAGILAFVSLPLSYLIIDSCPYTAEAIGSNRWRPPHHRLALLIVTFLMGTACGFSFRNLPNSPFMASIPIPILVGIAAYFIGQRIDQWALCGQQRDGKGMDRVHVIAVILVTGLLPNTILNLAIYGMSAGFWVSLILTAVLMVVRFQLTISGSKNNPDDIRSKSAGNEWEDRVLPIIMTDLSLIFDCMVRYIFSSTHHQVLHVVEET